MNAMSGIALGDGESLEAQYGALQAEMEKIKRAMLEDAMAAAKAKEASQLHPVRARERKVPAWVSEILEDALKNKLTLGQWGPAR